MWKSNVTVRLDLQSCFLKLKATRNLQRCASVLNDRVDLHAIDATSARWRRGAGLSPPDLASTTAAEQ